MDFKLIQQSALAVSLLKALLMGGYALCVAPAKRYFDVVSAAEDDNPAFPRAE